MNHTEPIEELKSLSDEGVFRRDKIEWWLLKYDEYYQDHYRAKEDRSGMKITCRADAKPHIKKSIDLENKINWFLDTYEALDGVSEFYRVELYFKDELELYKSLKNDKAQLNSWLEKHKLDEGKKYKEFVYLFQDNRTLSGYKLDVLYPLSLPLKISLDESEFKYTLKFLEILEMSSKIEVTGIIEIINDLEVIELNKYQIYNRQTIVVSLDDGHESEIIIKFLSDKTQLLDTLKVGQKVKVYAGLRGGQDGSNKLGYSLTLLGWSVKLLTN
jgi:hypothetical protein